MRLTSQSTGTADWHSLAVPVVLGGWLVMLAMGWSAMTAFGFKRDVTKGAAPPVQWPTDSHLPRINGRDSLWVFLHPKCPCSQATMAELEKLLTSCSSAGPGNTLQVYIVAAMPRSAEKSWAETSLIQRSLRLANAELFLDRGGVEAARFAAQVSGTVMLFDGSGALRYAGGVTIARGHEGDNAGRDALARLLAGEPGTVTIPAFGCRLVLEGHDGTSEPSGPSAVEPCCDRMTCALGNFVEAPRRGDSQ